MKKPLNKNKVYLASSMDAEFRDAITKATEILRKKFDTNT